MSQLRERVVTKEQRLCIELQDARTAIDLTLHTLAKLIDERDALKAELADVVSERMDDMQEDEFLVPWGFCEDDD